jgi:Holliday junction resolvase RusA-like endonuclease
MAPPSGLGRQATADAISKPADTGADVDNLAKSLLDGMNQIVYHDDRQVALLTVGKVYGREPQVRIIVRQIQEA